MDEDFKIRYMQLRDKVREMLDAQQAYFRSHKDFQLLKKSKAIETEVKDLVSNKPKSSQAQLDWLGQ